MSTESQGSELVRDLKRAAESLKQGKHRALRLLVPEKRKRAPLKVAPLPVKAAKKVKARVREQAKPVSGQSGPPIKGLDFEALNKKEKMVLGTFDLKGEREVRTIDDLATEAFRSQSAKKANSWVRNSLRRLIRARLVEKTEPGKYRITERGRKLAS